jgi:hypothetical protein
MRTRRRAIAGVQRLKQLKPRKLIAGHRAETFLLDKSFRTRGRSAA